MRQFDLNSAINYKYQNSVMGMNISQANILHKDTNTLSTTTSANDPHLFDPDQSCFEICDNKACQISQTCIQKSQLDTLNDKEKSYLPSIGILPTDDYMDKSDDSSIATPSVFKSLNQFVLTSFFLHAMLISTAIALVIFIEPFIGTLPNHSSNKTAMIDVVMIDTTTMNILPINQVKVSESFAQSINDVSRQEHSVPTPDTDLIDNKETKQIQNNEISTISKDDSPLTDITQKPSAPAISPNTSVNKEIIKPSAVDIKKTPEAFAPSSLDTKQNNQNNTKAINEPIESNINIDKKKSEPSQHKLKNNQKTAKKDTPKKQLVTSEVNSVQIKNEQLTALKVQSAQSIATSSSIEQNHADESTMNKNIQSKESNSNVSNSQMAKPIKRPYPDYPQRAAALNLEGAVTAKFDINSNGKVTNIRIISSYPDNTFEKEVKRALRTWVYERKPTQDIMVTFQFKLSGVVIN
ncbi:TonB family protein [Thorsellia anophelis]|uniref:Protein TonB n=1 Tax=Thorsellia anophelis DSM 18579 TaxID=1123402 RepID=A0A1I0EDY5_9GAMM|nr:TonB family protein [Thorsellia anophelis]SET43262.1 TonB family C-terminal domain-containing protein [Thorsellia anophelis DSM 18579]